MTGDDVSHSHLSMGGLEMRSHKLHAYRDDAKGVVTWAGWADKDFIT